MIKSFFMHFPFKTFKCNTYCLLILTLVSFSAFAEDVELTKDEREYIQQNPIVKVHAEKAWRPFNFIENDEVKGYSNDVMRLVAKNVGLEIEFITGYHWNDYLLMLKQGDIDVISNMKRTPEREKFAIFTQHKPLNAIDGLLTLNETAHYSDFNYLTNKNVAVVRGFFYEELMRAHFPEINLLLTNSTEESIEQLILGNVDAVIDSYAVMNYYVQRYFVTGVTNIPLLENSVFNHLPQYMGINKHNPVLRNILNKGLQKISTEELSLLQQRWSITENSHSTFVDDSFKQVMPVFTESEQRYLKSKASLKMCVDPDWLPIEGIRNGVYTGMGSDFVRLFNQRISTPIQLMKTESWAQSIRYMKQGLCDFIPIINRTEKDQHFLTFTYPYLRFPLVLVTQKNSSVHNLKQALRRPIGIVKDYSYKKQFDKDYPRSNLREYTSAEAGLQALKSGEIYAFIDSLPVMARHIQQNHPELKIVDKIDYQHALSLAVAQANPALLDIFNKVIATISRRQHEEIINRWLPLLYESEDDNTWVWYLVIAIIILFLLIILHNHILKKSNQTLQKMQTKFELLAMRDFLTGLPNRQFVTEQLEKEWARGNRSLKPISVVLLDIDYFKNFNEQYGRLAGDRCLIELSQHLQLAIKRPADLLARYSGEEFILVLPETDEEGVITIVSELSKAIKAWALPHASSECGKILTLSAGSATLKFNSKYGASELIRRADNALYKAQQKGHNQLVQYQKKKSDDE